MRKPGGGSSDKPAALVLSPEAPYPIEGGGALRTASLLCYLGGRYTLDLVVFREPGAPDPREALPDGLVRRTHVIELPVHARTALARAARNLVRVWRGAPPLNDRFAGFGPAVAAWLSGRRYELALVEHSWCAPYYEQIAPHAERVVLDLHNVESALYRRMARAEPFPVSLAFRRFAQACARLERQWLPKYSLVLATSGEDAARLPGCPVEVYPNAIPLRPVPAKPEEHVVMFSGNLEYQPNVSAVRYFRRCIWPLLARRWPGLRWRLVGKNPQGVARIVAGDPGIELTGPVDDAVEALAAAKVAVAPLLAGSGTRFKILEAWSAARAVVSTALGAEGLPARHGEHLLLADTPESFAEAVSSLLASEPRRAELGQAGRALYEREFTWEAAWRKLAEAGV